MSMHRIHGRNLEHTHSIKNNDSNSKRYSTKDYNTSIFSKSIAGEKSSNSSHHNEYNTQSKKKSGTSLFSKIKDFFNRNKKDSSNQDKYKYYDDFVKNANEALKDINNAANYATTPTSITFKSNAGTSKDSEKETDTTLVTNSKDKKTKTKTTSKSKSRKTSSATKSSSKKRTKTSSRTATTGSSKTSDSSSTSSTGATSSTKAIGSIKSQLNDPQKLYETLGLKKLGMNYDVFKMAIEGYNNLDSKYKTTGYLGIFDTTQSSKKERYYLINLNTGEIQRSVMKTGSGDMSNVAGANKNGSHATLSGFQQIGEQYYSSKMGKNARRINGLESCNSNARSKSTVAHYTTGEHTWGCLGFTPVYKNGKIDKTATDNKLKTLFPTGAITFTYPTDVKEYKSISKLV
ncbi:murein L,D-transpeptidase catalytic domain family protein [bacterium]|nr:murein L,D-transpeptidase catalytic domain family protein [bacterium]